MKREFTYEIVLQVRHVECNPDMPTLNINALGSFLKDVIEVDDFTPRADISCDVIKAELVEVHTVR